VSHFGFYDKFQNNSATELKQLCVNNGVYR